MSNLSHQTQGQVAAANSALRNALISFETAMKNVLAAQAALNCDAVWNDKILAECSQRTTTEWLNQTSYCIQVRPDDDHIRDNPPIVDNADELWKDHENLLDRLHLSNRAHQPAALVAFRGASLRAKAAWNQFLVIYRDGPLDDGSGDDDSGFGDESDDDQSNMLTDGSHPPQAPTASNA